jgi:putative FmdB family regulatory protein
MPRYDYVCDTCQVSDEVTKSYSELDVPHICVDCGSEMKRAINMPNFAGCFPTRQGWDKDKEKAWDGELNSYYSAVKQGIEPRSTKKADIDAAVRLSNDTGKAFDGTSLTFKE